MRRLAALAVRDTIRGFVRQKSLFTVALLTLTLGLSLSTAMICVVYGVTLRPIAYDPDRRLVIAWAGYDGGSGERESFTEPALAAWGARTRTLDGVVGFQYASFTLLRRGEPVELQGALVSPAFFAVLNSRARVGGTFSADVVREQQGRVIVLSHKLWQQRFEGDPDVVGQQVDLGGELHTVAGVMPADFDVPSQNVALWAPLPPLPAAAAARARNLIVIARLRPSASREQAEAEANTVARALAAEFPDTHRGMRIHLVPFFDELIKDSRLLLLVAAAAALLVLLICCAHVSNLMLVRAIVRRSEFATRLALGAARRHLAAIVLCESLVLAACSGLAGGGVARWMIDALLRWSPIELPRAAAVGQGLQIPIVAATAVLLTALLISLPAAWEVMRRRLTPEGGLGSRGTSRRFAEQFVVAVEIAITLTLVVGSSVMARTLLALRNANPGWQTDHLLAAQITLPKFTYPEPHHVQQFYDTFLERLRATPGVVSAAASSALPASPLGIDVDLPIQVPGRSPSHSGQASVRLVTPGLFQTLGIPLVEGRDLDRSDAAEGARRIVVNRAFARTHLSDAPSAIGRQVVVVLEAPATYEIVGVVGDVHHYGMLRDPKPEFYLPFASRPLSAMGVVVRTRAMPVAFAPTFRQELAALTAALPVASLAPMDTLVRDTWNDRTFLTVLIAGFTVIVVVLTIVGVFSVMTYSVSRQMRVIAIHMAIGAGSGDVVRFVLRRSARTIGAGLGLGLVGAWMLGQALAGMMYRVSAGDPRVLLAGAVGVVIVAGIGAYLPSRRATTIEPSIALRAE